MEGRYWVFCALRWRGGRRDSSGISVGFVGGEGIEGDRYDVLRFSLQDGVALCVAILGCVGCVVDDDVGQIALVRLFPAVCCLRPFVPRDVLMVVFWWGRSEGKGSYPVQGDWLFPRPARQDVYARVPRHCAQVCWGPGGVCVGLRCKGWSRVGRGAQNGAGRCRMG